LKKKLKSSSRNQKNYKTFKTKKKLITSKTLWETKKIRLAALDFSNVHSALRAGEDIHVILKRNQSHMAKKCTFSNDFHEKGSPEIS